MSKGLTFDEWFSMSGWDESIRGPMEECWRDAIENAAMVCEPPMATVSLQVGEMPRKSILDARAVFSWMAAAIRKAAIAVINCFRNTQGRKKSAARITTPHKIITTVGESAGVFWLVSIDGREMHVSDEEIEHAYSVCKNYSMRMAGDAPDEWNESDMWLIDRGLCVTTDEIKYY